MNSFLARAALEFLTSRAGISAIVSIGALVAARFGVNLDLDADTQKRVVDGLLLVVGGGVVAAAAAPSAIKPSISNQVASAPVNAGAQDGGGA